MSLYAVPAAIAASLFIVLGGCLGGCTPAPELPAPWSTTSVDLETWGLFDLGIVDANDDGRLDLYTVNHSGPQSIALNQGARQFSNAFADWHLDQDPAFPGLAVVPEASPASASGIYIDWEGPDLLIRAVGAVPAAGTIELYSAVEITRKDAFDVTVTTRNLSSRVDHTRIDFAGSGDGQFALRPAHHAQPIHFSFGDTPASAAIHVGPRQVSPPGTAFAVAMRDRHGMAWSDYDGDGRTDLFITRGGMQGTMVRTPLRFRDELFVWRDHAMVDLAGESGLTGLEKEGCPGRQAAWVDHDQDGRLDLYVVCGRDGDTDSDAFPNRLLQQQPDGSFVDVARSVGLDLPTEGKFLWLDDDDDGDPDLLWADRVGISRYVNDAGRFRPDPVHAFPDPTRVTGLRQGDFDGDGSDDVLVVSPTSTLLLQRLAQGFRAVTPEERGLPSRNLDAQFVDVDNSGREAFFSVPHGLFRRTDNGRFEATGELAWSRSRLQFERLVAAQAVWGDFDGDGTRELVLAANRAADRSRGWLQRLPWPGGSTAVGRGALRGTWDTRLISRSTEDNHWLQVSLVGPPGNRPGLGARIQIDTASGSRSHAVGHAESANYSQGHHLVYFGLGSDSEIRQIRVQWPDGLVSAVSRPKSDQRLVIDWPGRIGLEVGLERTTAPTPGDNR